MAQRTDKKTGSAGTKAAASARADAEKAKSPAKEKTSERRDEQNRRVWSVLLLAAGILLIMLFVIPGEEPWERIGNFFYSMFGIASWILALLMLYCSVLLALDIGARRISLKVFQALIVSAFVCSLFYTAAAPQGVAVSYGEAVKEGWTAAEVWSGGAVGAVFGWLLMRFGKAPALIIESVAAVAAFVIMSGKGVKNVIEFFKRGRGAKEQRRKERAEKADGESGEENDAGGFEIPPEATAASRLNGGKAKKGYRFPQRAAEEVPPPAEGSADGGDSEQIPVTRPEPTKQQLADLEAAISSLNNMPKKRGADLFEDRTDGKEGAAGPEGGESADKAPEQEGDVIFSDSGSAAEELEEAAGAAAPAESSADGGYKFPPIDLLNPAPAGDYSEQDSELRQTGERLIETLRSFGAEARIVNICPGPSVTRYEVQPSVGIKVKKIACLSDDIALALAARGIIIEGQIPGKSAIGIQIPNRTRSIVCVREVMESEKFIGAKSTLTVALGKDITGNGVVVDIAKLPHLLIAGTTGSGKSVCLNSIIISLLYKAAPRDVRFILIDPKKVEMNSYRGIPHLLIPVVSDFKKAAGALAWAVNEMEDRYNLFMQTGVRDICGYNEAAQKSDDAKPLPNIVIIIDELADLMLAAKNDVEGSIIRLAQKARAAGMHLIIATQRPSVDVITGLIKTNIADRIAFKVSSQMDSRVIMDFNGAEKLLGQGDMLFNSTRGGLQRVQGCFVSDAEVRKVVDFITSGQTAQYDQDIELKIQKVMDAQESAKGEMADGIREPGGRGVDSRFAEAIDCVVNSGYASTSQLQRKMGIGFTRAGRMIDEMEERGIIGPLNGSKPRDVLITPDQWAEMKNRWLDE